MTIRASLIFTLLALLAPTNATASTLWSESGEIRYAAANGEANDLSTGLQPPSGFTIQDLGVPAMTVLSPCTIWDLPMGIGSGGICPPAGVESMQAVFGDGHDTWWAHGMPIPVRMFGEEGNDTLTGSRFGDTIVAGPGQDGVDAREGDDEVYVDDGQPDSVSCGAGTDSVASDPTDQIAGDCERAISETPPSTTPDGVSVSHAKRRPLRRALALGIPFRVSCGWPCGVEARLTVVGGTRLAGRTVGARGRGLPEGEHLVVTPIARHARRALHGLRGGVTVRLRVVVRDLTAADDAAVVRTGRIRLTR
jgi:Ca2+-binding RTX toxin-like protein